MFPIICSSVFGGTTIPLFVISAAIRSSPPRTDPLEPALRALSRQVSHPQQQVLHVFCTIGIVVKEHAKQL
jgi:hypothetical protein